MKIGDGKTLLFQGDSISDCGRARPVGQRQGLGDGYVMLADAMLGAWYPDRRLRVLNTGISGNRVIDLEARWQSDTLDLRPDWLSIMIGINDVWRQFDCTGTIEQVDAKRYEAVYRRLLEATRPRLEGLVLMTPYYLEANAADPMRALMDRYGAIVRQLADDFDAIFVDTQAAFDAFLAHRPTQSLCGDRVHPNKTGHMVLARAFLDAIGCDWHHTP